MVPPAVLETSSQTCPEVSFLGFCFLHMAVDLPVISMEKENPANLHLLKDRLCFRHPHCGRVNHSSARMTELKPTLEGRVPPSIYGQIL